MAEGVTHVVHSSLEDKVKGTSLSTHLLHALRPSVSFLSNQVVLEVKDGELRLKLGAKDAEIFLNGEKMRQGDGYEIKLGKPLKIICGTKTLIITLNEQRPTTEEDLNKMQTVVPIKIDVKENLDSLFALDVKISKASTSLLPLETKEQLLDFLTVEHKTETYASKDSKENMVGYISIIDKPKEEAIEVLNVGVDPEFRRERYGEQMMKFAEELATERERKKVTLVTNIKNLPAINFYERIGYTIIKKMPNYYGDGETRYLFEKVL